MAYRVEHARSQAQIIWANKPFSGRLGRYVAIRLRDGVLSVAIRHRDMLEWVPVRKALTDSEASRWARRGF